MVSYGKDGIIRREVWGKDDCGYQTSYKLFINDSLNYFSEFDIDKHGRLLRADKYYSDSSKIGYKLYEYSESNQLAKHEKLYYSDSLSHEVIREFYNDNLRVILEIDYKKKEKIKDSIIRDGFGLITSEIITTSYDDSLYGTDTLIYNYK